jgi:hypothetical protein
MRTAHLINLASFSLINETIICIDDLERKKLTTQDMLGLVSLLKLQKKCKVVLLFNEDGKELKDYEEYREKVIDIELEFSPTVEKNVEIAFKDNPRHDAIQVLKESAIKLHIKNIRVLKQIERFVNLVMDCIGNGYEPEITQQIVSSLTLFAWCYYCHKSDGAPPLDYVTKQGIYKSNDSSKIEADNKENYQKWDIRINSYGYKVYENNLNLALANVVKTGYCIEAEIKELVENENNKAKQYNSNCKWSDSYNEALDFFYSGFNDNSDKVCEVFNDFLQNNLDRFDADSLLIKLLRDIEKNDEANKIIDFYFESIKNNPIPYPKHNLNIKDEYFIKKLDEININEETPIIQETAKDVLERISGKNGWTQNDKIILFETTTEQYSKVKLS